MTELHFVVPEGIDDPARPSGGNAYDRHVARGLAATGWTVHEHAAPGPWPERDATALAELDAELARIPDDAVVLLDGLVASAVPDVLVPHADRLRLVVLVHMPLGHRPLDGDARERERSVLSAALAVVTTSAWSRRRLIELYELPAGSVHVAQPGVVAAELAAGTAGGEQLLCVAAVTFDKGHDLLVDALTAMSDLAWNCVCVGSLDRDPEFAATMHSRAPDGRVSFAGVRTGAELDRSYAAADLLVLPSRAETYGMVVTEALAHGLPVIAADVGGVTEALGESAAGALPGLLVRPDDPRALATALRAWLVDSDLRATLRAAARDRRETLAGWPATTAAIAKVLAEASR